MTKDPKKCPETYAANEQLVQEDIAEALPGIIEKMKWNKKENILDHGCRTGWGTYKLLLPMAEKMDSKIYAVDSCKSMTKYAEEHFPSPRIEYVAGNLTSYIPPELKDVKFNRVFSVYTLHFTGNYREELKAIYDQLVPDGEMFLMILAKTHLFDLFKLINEHEHYKEHTKGHLIVPDWGGPGTDPIAHFKEIFENIGFQIIEMINKEHRVTVKDAQEIADMKLALMSFINHISNEDREELRKISHRYIRHTPRESYTPNPDPSIKEAPIEYDVLHVRVKKP